ncbi:ATP-binding protein [Pseudorhodobacter sp.]|uniref:ATP-binding protein n=1 Tax=Pseudorhodobacter sp. TaxID=1934400 RepID=UPI0026487134|nr:ATP-binding protein [Pseudorhodobacter sp.]MDN5788700.1 ATP-binding protein [Pseudorhodobacter sp.]
MFRKIKTLFPRSLYGRAALILIVPVVTIQLVVSITFLQRHYERVTQQLTGGVAIEMRYLLAQIDSAASPQLAQARMHQIADAMGFGAMIATEPAEGGDQRELLDLAGKAVITTLRAEVPQVQRVELLNEPRRVRVLLTSAIGPIWLEVDRGRLTATNPHQLLVLMILTSILMTLIAYQFLRNQLRPIKRLADVATAFGKGQNKPYRPRGALEVRSAGKAFLDMRARIERQIEQRTLMLSGISHDLRTPLTRLRLGLSMLPEDDETEALLSDVGDMQRLIDEFLSFARGDAMEAAEETDPRDLIGRIVDNGVRAGQDVTLAELRGSGNVMLRPAAVTRAVENLIGNAVRYGTRAIVGMDLTEETLRIVVEDDGPGIAKELREEAMTPFTRLDSARDPNRGGGVGLGLAITQDIARSHGGRLNLGHSKSLGGLRAEFVIAR